MIQMCSQGNTINFAKADLAGIRTSLSVPSRALQKRALEEGWDLSDLARILICLGATSYFLRLRKPETCERLKLLARMSGASKALDVAAVGDRASPGTRPNT